MRILIPLLSLLLSCICLTGQTIYYVDANASGLNDGSSWGNAFTDLQVAINTAIAASSSSDPGELWVKQGSYYPSQDYNGSTSPGDPREKTFSTQSSGSPYLSILGGFNGSESNKNARDPEANKTYLSGLFDLNYHVVVLANIDDSFIIDGFIIEFGNASGAFTSQAKGAAVYSNQTASVFRNCTIENNLANLGGAAVYAFNSALSFEDCQFKSNTSGYISATNDPQIILTEGKHSNGDFNHYLRCTFSNNVNTSGTPYCGILELSSYSIYENCSFNNNDCNSCTGLMRIKFQSGSSIAPDVQFKSCTMYNDYNSTSNTNGYIIHEQGTLSMANCTAYNNGHSGNAFLTATQNGSIHNSILWNSGNELSVSSPVSYSLNNSLIKGITPANVSGTDIYEDMNPLFTNAPDGNLLPLPCSPAYNTGNNTFINSSTDMAGNSRTAFTTVDIGAYEIQIQRNTLSGNNVNQIADKEIVTADGWTQYYNCENNQLLLEVKKNGEDIGTIGDGTFQMSVNNNSNYGNGTGMDLTAANYVSASSFYAGNKSWTLTPTSQPLNNVSVRFFYDALDIADLNGSYSISGIEDAVIFKVPGANAYATNISSANYHEYMYGTGAASSTEFITGTKGGMSYAEFVVSSFSSGGIGAGSGTGGGALPIELMAFEVNKIRSSEVGIRYHLFADYHSEVIIERSKDGRNWIPIQQYIYETGGEYIEFHNDATPLSGINYYRLRMYEIPTKDLGYSNIASIDFSNSPIFRLSSNIISSQQLEYFYTQGKTQRNEKQKPKGFIYNSFGQLLQVFNIPEEGRQSLILNKNIGAGQYWISIQSDRGQLHQEMIIKI